MVNTPTNTTEAQHFVLGGYITRVYHTYVYKHMCIKVCVYIYIYCIEVISQVGVNKKLQSERPSISLELHLSCAEVTSSALPRKIKRVKQLGEPGAVVIPYKLNL